MQIKHREEVICGKEVGHIDDINGSYVAVDFEHYYRVFHKKDFCRDINGTLKVGEHC